MQDSSGRCSRRAIITVGAGIVAAGLTNCISSLGFSVVSPALSSLLTHEEAERDAATAREALGALALPIAEQRYDDFRRALRAGAPSRIRIACRTLAQDGPQGANEAYGKLIREMELVDLLALKASRGDKAAADKVLPTYDALVAKFDEFLDLIPSMTVKMPS